MKYFKTTVVIMIFLVIIWIPYIFNGYDWITALLITLGLPVFSILISKKFRV